MGESMRIVGKIGSGDPDQDGQLIDDAVWEEGLADWMAKGAPIRWQHNPAMPPVGVGESYRRLRAGEYEIVGRIIDEQVQHVVATGEAGFAPGLLTPLLISAGGAPGGRVTHCRALTVSLISPPYYGPAARVSDSE